MRSLTFLAGAMQLLQSSCIPIPIPHTVTEHGTIRGRVVDDVTGQPVSGALAHVGKADDEPEATTDAAGDFVIAEREGWRLFWVVPLLPIDPAWTSERVEVVYPGTIATADGNRPYRNVSVSVRSRRPSWIVGDNGEFNRGVQDDLGTVRLKLYEPIPRQ